jgi:hypothetical protein
VTATNAKWGNGGPLTFFNAKSSQAGQWIQAAPHRVQETRSHALALPPGSASRVWWSAGISLVMQITRRWKRRFHETLRRVTSYFGQLFGRRRKHLYICSRCGMPIESWPKGASRQQVEERRTTDSARAAWVCRLLRFPTRQSLKGWCASASAPQFRTAPEDTPE